MLSYTAVLNYFLFTFQLYSIFLIIYVCTLFLTWNFPGGKMFIYISVFQNIGGSEPPVAGVYHTILETSPPLVGCRGLQTCLVIDQFRHGKMWSESVALGKRCFEFQT